VKEHNEVIVTETGVPYRRRYVRIAVSFPVTYARDGESETNSGLSSDLGGGGLRLATDEDLPLGSVLLLRFGLPQVEREIVVRGRIVLSFYNAEDGRFFHGVVFTHIDPRDQEEIVRYVAGEVQRRASEDDLEGEPAE
jgi:c-di-GMP-binding flagellar brake protein YcgR